MGHGKEDFHFITGQEWQNFQSDHQEVYIDQAFQYWRQRGFPHYDYDLAEIRKQFNRLATQATETVFQPNDELNMSTIGVGLANFFHPQMWSVKVDRYWSPMQCFEDDKLLKACLRKALTIWPNKRGASPSVLREMLRTFRNTQRVYNFRPMVAKALYQRYSKPGARILDFSAGYSGRLLGCLPLLRHYIGFDPSSSQIYGLRQTYLMLHNLGLVSCSAEFHQVCAEDALPTEAECIYDLIFTSPPYFDREKYSNEDTQSFVRYPTYHEWCTGFLSVVVRESYRVLKPGGYLILNVADKDNASVATDTLQIAMRLFNLVRTYRLRLNRPQFHRNGQSTRFRYEPIFVFRK